VFQQNPAAGASVPPGSVVHYTIAQPLLGTRTVPDVFGRTRPQAIAAISAAGLTPDVQEIASPGHPAGRVFSQSPAAGATRPAGAIVIARVATPGPGLVSVPNLIGLTPTEAGNALAGVGLVSQGMITIRLDRPLHRVYSQSRVAGSMVPPGTTVRWRSNP
jgi:beta-lactam-binding protein with PASTA domain